MDGSEEKKDILVVVSKLKNYIRSVSGMSTSANVAPKLSDAIRRLCDQAIEKTKLDGRKTVMDRDFD
jgi:histone H3/H4